MGQVNLTEHRVPHFLYSAGSILTLFIVGLALSAQPIEPEADTVLAGLRTVISEGEGCAPTKAYAWEKIGEIEQSRNANSAAVVAFEMALQCGLSQPAIWYRLGLSYSATGEQRKAVAALTRAVDGGFRNTAALFHLVESAFASRQGALGVERSRELMSLASRSSALMLRTGQLLFDRLYYRDALKAFTLAVEADPDDRQSRFYLGLTQHLLNESDAAIGTLQPLAEAAPTGETLTLLAAVYAQKRDYSYAGRTLDLAIAKYPDSPHPDLNRALMYLEQDQLEHAAGSFSQFRRRPNASGAKVFVTVSSNHCLALQKSLLQPGDGGDGDNTGAYFQDLAAQMFEKYHYGAAVQLLRLALRNGSSPTALLFDAGRACFNLDPQSEAALVLLEAATLQSPENADAWYLLGRAHMRQSRHAKAVPAFERAVARKPTALHYLGLGRAYMVSDTSTPRHDDAIAMLKQSERLNPADAAVHYELARVYSQTEQFQKARAHLEKAIDVEPDFYEAYYLLGRVCTRLGKQEDARKYLSLFEQRRHAAKQHSVLDNGYSSEGHSR